MNKHEQLKELKYQVEQLEKELENESFIQEIPAKKLEWGPVSEEKMNWEKAKDWCEKRGIGWRLPTLVELLQAYYDNVPGFSTPFYWSATEYSTTLAWNVYFSSGNTFYDSKSSSSSVRCVREL